MSERKMITVDGNEAVASVAFRTNEVASIYPITPSSPMGEHYDAWGAMGRENIWGSVPQVQEMQSEGGAIAAVHGALQAGSVTTTFTASQGLLLMIPNLFKIAGELTSCCIHVSARTVATHALSIFGDHSDVMACRDTGWGMLASGSVQEAHDMAIIGQTATFESRVPMIHFFDGFRTSHEVAKIEELTDDDLKAMINDELIEAHRDRALSPDKPIIRGTAQNPDTFFQTREANNKFYMAAPDIVQKAMDQFAQIAGRQYKLFDYVGHPEAEKVIILMGSGAETAHEAVEYMVEQGEKVGLLKVRLYRPFSIKHFIGALPKTVKTIAALDRTKEPGSVGEPLYLDVVTALTESWEGRMPKVVGGRYGLSSKEFTPAMVKGVFENLGESTPKNHFTVGIIDDVTHLSLPWDAEFRTEPAEVHRAMFYGLGSDGTVGANKNSIKIIGGETDNFAQGYFVYDSKKAGALTVSHLRFGPRQIRSAYLIDNASFIACHQFVFTEKYDMLANAQEGATFLLNSPYGPDDVWAHLPRQMQQQIIDKQLKLFVIDAYKVARETGMGGRINTVMQTCFFALSGVLPRDEAIDQIKNAIKKTYGKKGDEIVQRNYAAVDGSLANLHEVKIPDTADSSFDRRPAVGDDAPTFVKEVLGPMMINEGDNLPVSAFPVDGTYPTATTKYEKRAIAMEVPVWDPDVCIQCNKCSMICPHAAIRTKVYDAAALESAPDSFRSMDYKAKDFAGMKFTIQVAPEDCTGCGLCVKTCPAKNKSEPSRKAINLTPLADVRETEAANFMHFLTIPDIDRTKLGEKVNVKSSQFMQPLFEFSGSCAGCGETPYVKLMTQLFGDRMLIANATGCSSIYGGNLPTTPYAVDCNGRGPTWSNSLFEDNAEFGFGFRLSIDTHKLIAIDMLKALAGQIGDELVNDLITNADRGDEVGVAEQRSRVEALKQKLAGMDSPQAKRLLVLADYLVKKSVWILGGDGWAYDIGYGGLDHVLAQPRDVNVLVVDTEVYSNTGGQASKATPIGAAAKFAASGKSIGKKDLGMMAMSYGHVYVARVAMGANDQHTVKAFQEAESYPGPSLIIAYSHCIAHGYNLVNGPDQQKLAVDSGIWPLYRYDPRLVDKGDAPLQLDSKVKDGVSVKEYMSNETRFRMVEKIDKDRYNMLADQAAEFAAQRRALYEQMAQIKLPHGG